MISEYIRVPLKLLVLMKKRATLVLVKRALKVMVSNAVTSMSVSLTAMTHVQSMQLVPTQKAVILVIVTTDMKAMVWFVKNKPDVKM